MKCRSLLAVLSLAILLVAGCGGCRQDTSPGQAKSHKADVSGQWSDQLFSSAINNLHQLEDADATELINQIVRRLTGVEHGHLPQDIQNDPLLASWPEPDALEQVVGRLNQWAENQEPPGDWKLDPLVATLNASLADTPYVRDLDKMQFTAYDGFALVETVWLRDISNWARGKTADELQQSRKLFDWTVRNIQLQPDEPDRIPLMPWETLLSGRGTAMERAWVYILLLRQQGIDAGMVALPVNAKTTSKLEPPWTNAKDSSEAARLRPWCVAVLIGDKDEKELYLFDPNLGLPIPARNGVRLEAGGTLDVQPATLDQVIADPSLLDRLDFDTDQRYWARAADLKHAVVAVEASPIYLAKRMKLVESHLVAQQKMVLSVSASTQAERLRAAAHATQTRIWNLPYQTLERRSHLGLDGVLRRLDSFLPFYSLSGTPLYKGRVLHLKGRFFDTQGAIECYQAARPATEDLARGLQDKARAYYETILLPRIKDLPADKQKEASLRAQQEAVGAIQMEFTSILRGKIDASYWLGLIAYEQENYPSAIDYFRKRTLEVTPNGPRTAGAHYNLARSYEALGQTQKAVEEYEAGVFSLADYGNALRARWLNELRPPANAKRGEKEKK